MILQMMTVYDRKSGVYQPPMFFRAKGEGIRSFMDAVGDGKSQFASHPEDYVFVWLGEYDDTGGVFNIPEKPEPVMTGLEAVRPQ